MAVLSKEELLSKLNSVLTESDDTSLTILEDFTDTFNDLETRSSEDWKAKFETNDAEWRSKYRERFLSTPETAKDEQKEDVISDGEKKDFEDLFSERTV